MQTKTTLFFALTLLPTIILAASNENTLLSEFKPHHGVFDLQVGAFSASQGYPQHININTLIGDDFSVDHSQGQNVLAGFGYFINGQNNAHVKMLYGVDAFYFAPTTVEGKVTQENVATNLSYRYSLSNYAAYFDAKTIFKNNSARYNITMDIGFGADLIDAYHFSETSLDGGITQPDNIFSSNTTSGFSATAGIGILIHHVLGRLPLECSYRFFYLGQGNLNKTNDQVLNSLMTGHNYANALMISTLF